jgi:sepiapterin reductase
MSILLFVSGASRGLGRSIAVSFCRSPLTQDAPLRAVLLARSREGLQETASQMRAARGSMDSDSDMDTDMDMDITNCTVDLGNLNTLEDTIERVLQQQSIGIIAAEHELERAILINCAGTTGLIGKHPSLNEIKEATALNFTSKAWLSSRFAQQFVEIDTTVTTIVNVSSMCAVKPTPTMGLYCATSAARDMFHTVLSQNHKHARILNYAPGSCDTDMQAYLRQHSSLDPAVQTYCQSLVDSDNGFVNCDDTADELVRRVLEPNGFVSGERVEFVNMESYKY